MARRDRDERGPVVTELANERGMRAACRKIIERGYVVLSPDDAANIELVREFEGMGLRIVVNEPCPR